MIIKNEMEDKIKFKVNNSKYITLTQNEEYNCDELGEVKIELLNPKISTLKKFLKTLFLMPLALIIREDFFSDDIITKYSFIYKVDCDCTNNCISFEKKGCKCIVKKENEILKRCGYSKLKTTLIWIIFFAYCFLLCLIIFIIFLVLKSKF
jgi:hypothetical protein